MGMAKYGSRAAALKNSPAIFAGGIAYNPVAGIPSAAGIPDAKYRDDADAARSRPGPAAVQKVPFRVRGEG